jgi:hypothetical protein
MNMKRLIMLTAVAACGIFGYTAFLNTPIAGAETRDMANLEAQFAAAHQSVMQASRSAATPGLDSTMDVEAARAKVRRVESQLQQVKPRLTSDESRKRADQLEEKIQAFLNGTE